MRWHRWTLLLSVAIHTTGHGLNAQDAAPAQLQAVLWHTGVRLSGLSPDLHSGAVVRLVIVGGGGPGGRGGPRISGRYAGMVGDTLLLDESAHVGLVVFDSLWTRHRPIVLNALRGAMVGAVVGGGYGLVRSVRVSCKSGSLTSHYFPWPDCRGRVGNIGRDALAGAVIGAAARVVLGEVFPKWKRQFP